MDFLLLSGNATPSFLCVWITHLHRAYFAALVSQPVLKGPDTFLWRQGAVWAGTLSVPLPSSCFHFGRKPLAEQHWQGKAFSPLALAWRGLGAETSRKGQPAVGWNLIRKSWSGSMSKWKAESMQVSPSHRAELSLSFCLHYGFFESSGRGLLGGQRMWGGAMGWGSSNSHPLGVSTWADPLSRLSRLDVELAEKLWGVMSFPMYILFWFLLLFLKKSFFLLKIKLFTFWWQINTNTNHYWIHHENEIMK